MADNSLPFESATIQPTNEQHDWRPVAGYEGRYEVSRLGMVRSLLTNRILSPHFRPPGYLTVCLYDGLNPKRQKTTFLHRIVAETFIGSTKGMQVNHVNGDKKDCSVKNLEIVTCQENSDHAHANGLTAKRYYGSSHVNSKLTERDVQLIKIMLSFGMNPKAVSRSFLVNHKTIADIKIGKAWAHVMAPKIIFE